MSKFTDEWGTFTAVANAFIEQSLNLSVHAKWMFVLLRFHTNQKSECAWPSYDQLQALTGLSRTTVSKAIRELEEYGWLERRKRFGASVVYVLKRPSDDASSPPNELMDNKGLNASSPETAVVHDMDYSSPENGLQKSTTETTASL